MRSRSSAAPLFMISAALGGSAVAHAQPTAAPLRFEYRAEAGCPAEAEFRARVGARLRRNIAETDTARAYVVIIERRDRRFVGRLSVRAGDGTASDRGVAGDTCDDVVAALAVVTALAVDTQAGDAPVTSATPAVSASPSAVAAPPPPASAPPAGAPPASAPPAGAPPAGNARPPAPEPDATTHLVLGAQLLVGQMIGLPSFGARISAEPPLAVATRGVGPARFDADLEVSSDVPVAGGSASFLRAALGADACPLGASLGVLRLSPCARVEGGLVSASRRGVAPARSVTRGWLALGLPVRARLPLWGAFVLDADAGVRLPLLRDGFFPDGADADARPPPIESVAALGLGLTIP
ncbi:hypothetical protein [Sorangium cellulosum]|uniref:hypothetical protein n=1 Tax=Sorangium cellulosum TaxID=56 RepID=UPI0012FFB2E3|nr:hypothetical protein [Sorangium cellulosum]